MPDYKEMYFKLSAEVSNAIEILITAQKNAENDYIDGNVVNIKNFFNAENTAEKNEN